MGKPTKKQEAIDWLRVALPKGYSVQEHGKGIRIDRDLPSGSWKHVLTADSPAELQTFLQMVVTRASCAFVDTTTAEEYMAVRAEENPAPTP